MHSKTRMAIIACAALTIMASSVLAAETSSRGRNRNQASGEGGGNTATNAAAPSALPPIPLPSEISIALEEMLKMVNEGKKPSKDDVAAVDNVLQQNKKNLLRFDPPSKTKYSMLTAWNSYFAGNMDGAVQAANAGLAAGPDEPDMRATYAAIAIAAEKYQMLSRLAPRPVAAKKKKAEMEEAPTSTSSGSGTLNFDAQALKPQAIGKKLAAVTDGTYTCIDGTTFAAGKTDMVCALAWRSVAVQKPVKPGAAAASVPATEEMGGETPRESGPASAFGTLMVDYTGSDKVAFIGVNLDDAAAKYNAMKEIAAQGWFWPQIMAMETSNKAFAEMAKYDASKPVMAIVKKDGTIAYMGSASGFLPKMIIAKATGDYAPKLFVPAKPAGMMDPNMRRAMRPDPNMRGRKVMDPNAAKGGSQGDVDEAMQMGSDLKAEELYNNAKSFLKGSRTTTLTAGPGVKACRQILEQYPNTEYAAKARELLRGLPDDLKTRYNITPAEMGQ